MDIRKFFQPKHQVTCNPSTHNESSPPNKRRHIISEYSATECTITEEIVCVDLVNHVSKESSKLSCPSVCSQEQFGRWKSKWAWLCAKSIEDVTNKDNIGVSCSVCSAVVSLKATALTTERIEVEQRWISGVNAKNSKKMHDKISQHQTSKAHQLCIAQLKLQKEDKIKQSFQTSSEIWRRQNQEKVDITKRVFNTAYTIARNNVSFLTHEALIELQKRNGLDMGRMLFSDHSCSNSIKFIADSMQRKLIKFILETELYFSILVDESTTFANETVLIVYLRITDPDGEPANVFINLIELQGTTGVAIANSLYHFLINIGFSSDVLKTKLLGFCTDGASNLQGEYNGAIQQFMEILGRSASDVVKQHCMSHKLELLAHKVAEDINHISHVRQFIDTLYAYFFQSPKNLRDLQLSAAQLQKEVLKIGRIFDVRWLSSSYRSINALWKSLPTLCKFFEDKSLDMSVASKDRAKASGMYKKMHTWQFSFDLALLRDALEILKNLSLFLQRRDASILNARSYIDVAMKSIAALKEVDGLSLSEITFEYQKDGTVFGMKIEPPTDKEKSNFNIMRGQFLQGLVDNMKQRFPDEDLLAAGAALDPDSWPQDDVEKVFFGDREVLRLAKLCGINGASVVDEFRHYKQNVKKVGPMLKQLIHRIQLLPVSSAECERGFSSMNLDDTSVRNRLQIPTLAALIFIKVNGPTETDFQVGLKVI